MTRAEVRLSIKKLLVAYADCIAWEDFGPSGNSCCKPDKFLSDEQAMEAAYTLAAVTLEMPKGSETHKVLATKVAAILKKKYICYNWLRDAVTRILTGESYSDLRSLVELSHKVREKMKENGIKEITCIEEVLC